MVYFLLYVRRNRQQIWMIEKLVDIFIGIELSLLILCFPSLDIFFS